MKTLLMVLFSVLIHSGCASDSSGEFSAEIPVDNQDGINVGNPTEVQLDEDLLRKAAEKIRKKRYGEIHSMLIYRNDALVFEEYFDGPAYQWDAPRHYGQVVTWDTDMPHCIHSDTKSITSLCIGIAIDKGFIQSVNQSMFDYLPDYAHLKTNENQYITIEHLLTMTSGLRWEEWGVSLGSIENDQIGIWFWEDGPMNYVLSRELVAEPGTRYNYSGGDIQILVEILEQATGMGLDEFSRKYIFEPMGITSNDWWLIFESGEIQGAGGLKLTPRDMVKIGAMMMNNGMWKNTRIVSEDWISKCSRPYAGNTGIKVPGEDLGRLGYGYTWWIKQFNYKGESINLFFALGWGGQKIMVIPGLDMVVVFTGANYTSNVHQFKIMKKYILPAML